MLGRVAGYEILSIVGSGGMGVVLKAIDPGLSRVVAIKILAPQLATSNTARKRFAREAQAAAAITHDNVIDIYSVSEFKGLPYLVMPYARGPSLQKRLDKRGPLPIVEVLRISYQIAAGLQAAHEQGLVHRDVKPANILFVDDVDRVLITDFGLARTIDDATITRTGVITGTPQYMSPEQARGEAIDERSDLFSLGSVVYALCTGQVPFCAESNYGLLRKISDSEPRPIRELNVEIPDWLCAIVAKLHAKSPDDRFQSASEAAETLRRWLAFIQSPSTERPPKIELAPPRHRDNSDLRKPLALALTLLFSTCLLYFSLVSWYGDRGSYAHLNVSSERLRTDKPSDIDIAAETQNAVADLDSIDFDLVTRKRLKAVIMAIHSYADAHEGRLPPPAVPNQKIAVESRLSGFVLLLPYFRIKPAYLDQSLWEKVRVDPVQADRFQNLFNSIDLLAAWNDEVNAEAAMTPIEPLLMPGITPDRTEDGLPVSHIAFVQGHDGQHNGAFPDGEQVAIYHPDSSVAQISDGSSDTLALGQISSELGPWIAAGKSSARFVSAADKNSEIANFGGAIPGTAFFVRCDGSVRFVDLTGTSPLGLQALATRSAGDSLLIREHVRYYDSAAQFLLHNNVEQ